MKKKLLLGSLLCVLSMGAYGAELEGETARTKAAAEEERVRILEEEEPKELRFYNHSEVFTDKVRPYNNNGNYDEGNSFNIKFLDGNMDISEKWNMNFFVQHYQALEHGTFNPELMHGTRWWETTIGAMRDMGTYNGWEVKAGFEFNTNFADSDGWKYKPRDARSIAKIKNRNKIKDIRDDYNENGGGAFYSEEGVIYQVFKPKVGVYRPIFNDNFRLTLEAFAHIRSDFDYSADEFWDQTKIEFIASIGSLESTVLYDWGYFSTYTMFNDQFYEVDGDHKGKAAFIVESESAKTLYKNGKFNFQVGQYLWAAARQYSDPTLDWSAYVRASYDIPISDSVRFNVFSKYKFYHTIYEGGDVNKNPAPGENYNDGWRNLGALELGIGMTSTF